MALQFCEKCSGVILPRVMNGETLLLCNRCGWFKIVKEKFEVKTSESFFHRTEGEGVASKENYFVEGYRNKCKKCEYAFAEILDAGIRWSDEDSLILLRCLNCGASERIGRKNM